MFAELKYMTNNFIFHRILGHLLKLMRYNFLERPSNLTIANTANSSTIQGEEGKSLTLICTVENGRPAADLQWIVNGDVVSKVNGSKIEYTFDPSKDNNGMEYFCFANTSSYHLNKSVILDIKCKMMESKTYIIYSCHNLIHSFELSESMNNTHVRD